MKSLCNFSNGFLLDLADKSIVDSIGGFYNKMKKLVSATWKRYSQLNW